jgi:hypothetical protein
MGIYEAAQSLQETLERFDWLTAVAVGEMDNQPVIYVYLPYAVKSPQLDSLKRDGWMGYSVIIERVGTIRPAPA